MKGIISRAIEVYKEFGLLGACSKAFFKISRIIFDTNSAIWFERDLLEPIPEIKTRIPVEISLFNREETIEWIKKQKENWLYNQREIEVARREGHFFANVKHEGEIIGYIKAGAGSVYIEDYKQIMVLPKDYGFSYETYVLPQYRNKNLALYLNAELMRYARSIGIKKTGCHIPSWNIASLNVAKRLGFKKIKYVRHFRIFNCIKLWRQKVYSDEESN